MGKLFVVQTQGKDLKNTFQYDGSYLEHGVFEAAPPKRWPYAILITALLGLCMLIVFQIAGLV